LKIATWNVNSLRVRLPHVLEWIAQTGVDVLGLQETKLVDEKFPRQEIEAAGYHVTFAGQPTYNGVAILARRDRFEPPTEIQVNNPLFPDEQMRLIAATLTPAWGAAPLRFISAYVPNGSEVGSDKYAYKLRWLDALIALLKTELTTYPALAIVGDYNIAPADQDVHDPVAWKDQVLCSDAERERFVQLTALGLADAFRLFDQPANLYSWWDYRQAAFRRNRGLRIDHLLLSPHLASGCTASDIDTAPRKKEQPSDHAPAWAEITVA
jgi:exodeoxyribonuclease III